MPAPMTQRQARERIHELFAEHNLYEWSLSFNDTKRTAGTCNHNNHHITLSRYLLAQRSHADSEQTITHEVAHALTPGHGHDAVWSAQHRKLGGNGRRCFNHHDVSAPWVADCAKCERKHHRYRKPKHLDGWQCRCPRRGRLTWRSNDVGHAAIAVAERSEIRNAMCDNCFLIHRPNQKECD